MTYKELQGLVAHAEAETNVGRYDIAERTCLLVLAELTSSQQSSRIALEGDVPSLHASALRLLATIAYLRSDYPRALEHYEAALAVCQAADDKQGIAKAVAGIGLVYGDLADYPHALAYHHRALSLNEGLEDKHGIAICFGNIGLVHWRLSDYVSALEYFGKALALDEELDNKLGVARHLGNIGSVYNSLSNYAAALECNGKALALDQELENKAGVALHLGNIGLVHVNLMDYPRALEYYGRALALDEELGNMSGVARHLGNIGNVYLSLKEYSRALENFGRALALDEELGAKYGVAAWLGSIGNVHYSLAEYTQALESFDRALTISKELGDKRGVAISFGNIGETYAKSDFEGHNYVKAEEYLLGAVAISGEIGNKDHLSHCHELLANLYRESDLYKGEKRWENIAAHSKKSHDLKEEVHSEETRKQIERMEQHRQMAEREKRLAVERAEAVATKKLLHNMLPPQIAERLLNDETLIADHYTGVSILFIDLANFTRITHYVPPKHLVYLLNSIFSISDAVMKKHGLEKIKTIGDAYMAAAGAPVPQEDHAARAAGAALEVLEAMNTLTVNIPPELGDVDWIETIGEIRVRIGIHCGEAIGGVIGEHKFSFDLWGDAVNIASRMESHGATGKIQVSEEFMNAATNQQHNMSLQFIPRGEIDVKGKGKMRTYFLERK